MTEYKDKWCQEAYNKGFKEGRDFEKGQLTKAKEIIKDYMIVVTSDHTTVCSVPEENRCINVLKLNEQAEQFLKNDGCPDVMCEDCGTRQLGLVEVEK